MISAEPQPKFNGIILAGHFILGLELLANPAGAGSSCLWRQHFYFAKHPIAKLKTHIKTCGTSSATHRAHL
jgi:hypothetical protein